MSKTINLQGYIIDSGGTFFGTPGDDSASFGGLATSPIVIYLLGGNDIVGGGQFYDQTTITIFGGDGNDKLEGVGSVENFYGGKGNDLLGGYNKNDVLHGDLGNDVLVGQDGNDTLFGGKGNDDLEGGNGDDFIVSGLGQNVAYGDPIGGSASSSRGKDIFVIENFGKPGNSTKIGDFVDGEDKIGLANGLSFQELSITDTGFDLVISGRNSTEPLAILIKTVPGQKPLTVSSLTKDDFLPI